MFTRNPHSKSKHLHSTVKIEFGMRIPCEHKELVMFLYDNSNTNWKDAKLFVLKQIYNFDPFGSLIPVTSARIPPGHTKIQVHILFYYKQYGRYKAFMVASENVTGNNLGTYYSSFISLRYVHTVVFLVELNDIEIRTGDIINSYLTVCTTENIFFNAGAEFAPFVHVGHLLLINTAL